MSIEALWYSMYSDSGAAPHCTRYCRLPMWQQWSLTIDIARSFAEAAAGYRNTWIARTRETYWYWPHPLSASGWWLIPYRIQTRVFALYKAAVLQATRRTGSATCHEIAAVLAAWRRTGVWRRHASRIIPRTARQPSVPKNRKYVVAGIILPAAPRAGKRRKA